MSFLKNTWNSFQNVVHLNPMDLLVHKLSSLKVKVKSQIQEKKLKDKEDFLLLQNQIRQIYAKNSDYSVSAEDKSLIQSLKDKKDKLLKQEEMDWRLKEILCVDLNNQVMFGSDVEQCFDYNLYPYIMPYEPLDSNGDPFDCPCGGVDLGNR